LAPVVAVAASVGSGGNWALLVGSLSDSGTRKLRAALLPEVIRAFQIDCRFLPALGELCEYGLQRGVCGPFGQFSTPQRALTALLWISAHGVPVTRSVALHLVQKPLTLRAR
jgi:hypothetical protein